jgi:hypothetical protein
VFCLGIVVRKLFNYILSVFSFFIWAFPLAPKLQKTVVFFSYVCKGSGFAGLRYRFGAIAQLLASLPYNP